MKKLQKTDFELASNALKEFERGAELFGPDGQLALNHLAVVDLWSNNKLYNKVDVGWWEDGKPKLVMCCISRDRKDVFLYPCDSAEGLPAGACRPMKRSEAMEYLAHALD